MRRFLPILILMAAITGCRQAGKPGSYRIDPALMTLIPAETQLIVGTRLEKLRETPIYQKYFSQLPNDRLDDFARQTGVDPRKDVWEMLFCGVGKNEGVLMVRGKFAPSDMEPKLEKEGATRVPYKGYTLFGNEKTALFFMTPSVSLIGSTQLLKSIIDKRNTPANGVPASLQPLMAAIGPDTQFWAVFTGGVSSEVQLPDGGMLGNFNQIIRALENGSLAADLRTGLDLKAVGNCSSEDGARRIRDLLKGVIGFGRLNTADDQRDLLKVFDTIKVEQQAAVVTLGADIPENLVEKVVDMFTGTRKPRRNSTL